MSVGGLLPTEPGALMILKNLLHLPLISPIVLRAICVLSTSDIPLKYKTLALAFQELWCNKQLESSHIIYKLFLVVCYRLHLLLQGF